MSDETIQNACNQRKFSMLNNIAPVRFDPISPYSKGFTYEQITMRRKVEVLKYAKQSTQTKKLTKKERQAMIARGNYKGTQLFCTNDYAIPRPTSSSGIPGPITYLVEDKTVPLYNFLPNTAAYAVGNPIATEEWTFYTIPNITAPAGLGNITNVATLLIRETIEQPIYIYNYKIPVVYKITGVDIPYNTTDITINISITTPTITIYYGSEEINDNTTSINLDTSTFLITLKPDSSITSGTYNYSCQAFIGYIEAVNMRLLTSPGFSYNIGFGYTANKDIGFPLDSDSNLFTNITTLSENTTFSMIANVDDTYTISEPNNCELNTSVSTSPKTINFSGQ